MYRTYTCSSCQRASFCGSSSVATSLWSQKYHPAFHSACSIVPACLQALTYELPCTVSPKLTLNHASAIVVVY
eukprot:m.106046 g.106046  ORF g.106046 m.106046 type:complete len:73 (-) comp15295_c0_seq8:793-1011(-)